jgi:hypothetical protein
MRESVEMRSSLRQLYFIAVAQLAKEARSGRSSYEIVGSYPRGTMAPLRVTLTVQKSDAGYQMVSLVGVRERFMPKRMPLSGQHV